MPTRITKARICVFLMLTYGNSGVTLADKHTKKAVAENQTQDKVSPTPAPFITYSSVFDNYIPFDQTPDISWREANDNVGRIGGWRAYAKLVQEEAKKEAEQESQQKEGGKE